MTTKVVYKEYKHYLYHMIKDFTTYQQALKLKALGFDEPCFGRWWFNAGIHKLNEEELEIIKSYYFGLPEYYILAPTFSQAFRWFREKYGLQHDITLSVDNNNQLVGFYIVIHKLDPLWNEDQSIDFEVYTTDRDEAELACLDKLITLIK